MSRAPQISTRRAVKGESVRVADLHWHANAYSPRRSGPYYLASDATIYARRDRTNGRARLEIRAEEARPDLFCPPAMALLALCEVELDVEPEETSVRGNALASGDDAEDRAQEEEILRRLNNDDVWAWASVRVRVTLGDPTTGRALRGESSWLGCCSYADRGDFESPGGYYDDMLAEALADLAGKIGVTL